MVWVWAWHGETYAEAEAMTKRCLFVGGAADGQWHDMRHGDETVTIAGDLYSQETFWVDGHQIECVVYVWNHLDVSPALTRVFQGYSRQTGYQGEMGEA